MALGGYDIAQVCLNGHVTNPSSQRFPERDRAYCTDCGQPTIQACQECGGAIRGRYSARGLITTGYHRPAFCHSCGKPYPWTARSLEAARELAQEMEGLSSEEQATLAGTLDDLLTETPRTQVQATRFKRLLAKAGKGTAEALRKIMVDVMSEAAKKAILGP